MAVKAVIMAAGQGTRMKSDIPKVLHLVAGKPMVSWVIDAAQRAGVDEILVVVGHGAEQTREVLPDDVGVCVQAEQLGTGHAVQVALEALGDVDGDVVVVLSGDTPLLPSEAISQLIDGRSRSSVAAALMTAVVDNPEGYGRIVRNADDAVVGIVEQKDAAPSQLSITEINAGIYAFDGTSLTAALSKLTNDNAQGEYYLTDVIAQMAESGLPLSGVVGSISDLAGVNTQDQLADATAAMRRRIAVGWMERGVWVQDPDRVYISADTTIEPGASIYAGVQLQSACHVAADAHVGPEVFADASIIGAGSTVWYSVLRGATIGPDVEVGPYASLRPGAVLEAGSKAGTFVELKNTTVGPGAKVPHLSYMGDATIGADANIGAGSITCNYDGVHKHQTVVGDRAFVGSDTMLVAPVTIGDDAVTGAGSTITRDVPSRSLGVERSAQREIPGYADRIDKRRKAKEERS